MNSVTDVVKIDRLLCFKVVATVFFLISPAPCFTETSRSEDFQLTITMEKSSFLVGEGVLVNGKFENVSDAVRLAQPLFIPVSLGFQVREQDGTDHPYKGLFFSRGARGNDIEFAAHETYEFILSLNESYGESHSDDRNVRYFDPGIYYVKAFCIPERGGDTVASNTLQFEVIQPVGDEDEPFQLFIRGQSLFWKFELGYDECVRSFREIIERHPNSAYRLEAYHMLLEAFRYGQDSLVARTYAIKGIEEYPNSLRTKELIGPLVFSLPMEAKIDYLQRLSERFSETLVAKYCRDIVRQTYKSNKRPNK